MHLDYKSMPENIDTLTRERYRLALEKMKLEGKFRDIEFLQKLHRKDKLYGLVPILPGEFEENMGTIIEALDEKYGDNWDFHLQPEMFTGRSNMTYSLYVTTIYKELLITSENGGNHLIRDLIIAFNISSNNGEICFGQPRGTRATITESEANVNYRHSHLNTASVLSSNTFYFTDFCLGNATPMSEILADSDEEDYEFSREYFESILYLLDSVVEWESITGAPYIRISSIRLPGASYCMHQTYRIESHYSHNNFRSTLSPYLNKINYRFLNDRISIVDNKNFQEILKDIILDKGEPLTDYLVDKKTVENRYVTINLFSTTSNSSIGIRYPEKYFIFRGEKINFKIISERDDETDLEKIIDNAIIYPKFKDYVKKELEEELYKKAIRKEAIIREQHQSSDAR